MGKKRRRRSFSPEFKAEAVKVVQQSGKSPGAVARELDLTETALRRWVAQAETDAGRGQGGALTTDERAELAHLRRGDKTPRAGSQNPKKKTALFAQGQGGSSPSPRGGRARFPSTSSAP